MGGVSYEVHEAKIAAAVKAERERCAKIAEGWLETFGAYKPEHIGAHKWAADAVRNIIDNIRNEA